MVIISCNREPSWRTRQTYEAMTLLAQRHQAWSSQHWSASKGKRKRPLLQGNQPHHPKRWKKYKATWLPQAHVVWSKLSFAVAACCLFFQDHNKPQSASKPRYPRTSWECHKHFLRMRRYPKLPFRNKLSSAGWRWMTREPTETTERFCRWSFEAFLPHQKPNDCSRSSALQWRGLRGEFFVVSFSGRLAARQWLTDLRSKLNRLLGCWPFR